ncbi:hypothetical protein BH09PAT1_BH09PAT1_8390 [soil metagenome]
MNICKAVNCNRKPTARDMCNKHYTRWRKYGSESITKYIQGTGKTTEEKFWSRVDKQKNKDSCWNWLAGKSSTGYGQVTYKGKKYKAHRLAWFFIHGEHPSDCLLHSCDNRLCVNTEHLRNGTRLDNAKDRMSRNRSPIGELCPNALLSNVNVLKIKYLLKQSGMTHEEIGNMFNVSRKYITRINNNKAWRSITDALLGE